jgi:transcriptional regulator with XRE-family HTH domain
MRSRREELGWSQEKVGVEIGIDESSSRARISRYELGTHEPPVKTARLIAKALGVPLAYLYCDEEEVAALLKELAARSVSQRRALVTQWLQDAQKAA